MVGHLMGAAGALSALAVVKALHEGVIPPTINLDRQDPECDLDCVPKVARRARVRAALALLVGTVSQAAPPGKVLVVAIAKMDIRTLDPHRQYEISPPQIMRAAYETLVTLGDQGRSLTKLEPLLAESSAISSA